MTLTPSKLALHEPIFAGNEWKYVKECIDTAWVSSTGAFVDKFEKNICEWLGIEHAVAVVNGTAALHVSLRVAGVRAGDEVLVPSLTFIASVNSAVYLGAVPRFVDAEEATLGIDPDKLEAFLDQAAEVREDGFCYHRSSGRRISACVPVHIFGHPVRMDKLLEVCHRYHIPIIEDATESLGSTYRGRPTGSFGLLSCFSFNGNKIITTGGGGMVVSANTQLAALVRHLSTQAKQDAFTYWHDDVGYNYRLPNINAALGCAQLEQLRSFLERKRKIAVWYEEKLRDVPGLKFVTDPEHSQSNFWLNAVLMDSECSKQEAINRLIRSGCESRPLWTPCHRLPMFELLTAGDMDVTDRLWQTCVTLPSSANLGIDDVIRVCSILTGK